MAGKGGGAWKVAYADFVTAMMAFFLVMWICAQDQKIKQAVSYYFMDPLGASKKPSKSGSVSQLQETGHVPAEESAAMSRGRNSYQKQNEHSRPTKLVGDWLHGDKEVNRYWQEQATRQRDAATRSKDVKDKSLTVQQAATELLAKQLQEEVSRGTPSQVKGVYQDLLFNSIAEVNWKEIAEDLLKSN